MLLVQRMRNKVAHEGSDGGRSGGWTIFEHLVMAAYVFPLAVKLLLEREGHYVLTDTDRGGCWAVDQLLALAQVFQRTARTSGRSPRMTVFGYSSRENTGSKLTDSANRRKGNTGAGRAVGPVIALYEGRIGTCNLTERCKRGFNGFCL